MHHHIQNRHGRWWVPNPADEEENFADKWNEYPERRKAFIAWHHDITGVLDDLARLQGQGLPAVAARMAESFPRDVVTWAAQRYGDRLRHHTETGTLRMTSTGGLTTTAIGTPVRRHTFYGQPTNPRD